MLHYCILYKFSYLTVYKKYPHSQMTYFDCLDNLLFDSTLHKCIKKTKTNYNTYHFIHDCTSNVHYPHYFSTYLNPYAVLQEKGIISTFVEVYSVNLKDGDEL